MLAEVPTEPPPIRYARGCPGCRAVSVAIVTMIVGRDCCVAFYCQSCDAVFDKSAIGGGEK